MKKTINLFLAAFVLVAAVSCVKENIVENNENVETVSATFTMTAPRAVSESPVDENDPDSKTGLAQDGSTVVWKSEDKVDAVIWSTDNSGAKDAVVVAEMTCTLDADKEEDVFFVGSFSNGSNSGAYFRPTDSNGNPLDSDSNFSTGSMAVYPSTVTYSKSGTTRVYSYELPNTQTPIAGTFQDDIALLSAPFTKSALIGKYSNFIWSPAPGVPELKFKNACALIRVNLPEFSGRNIVSVKVEGTQPMAGQPANLTESQTEDGGVRLVPNEWTSPSPFVKLANSDNSAIATGTYYMVVWPGSHSKLTLTVTDAAGWYLTREVEGSFNFVESKVFNLNINAANAEFVDPDAFVDNPKPQVGSYYYTDGTISLKHDLEGKTLAGVIFSVNDDYSSDTDLMTAFKDDVTGLVVYKNQYSGAVTGWWYNDTEFGYCVDNYKGYTATNSFETSTDYKGYSGYLYSYIQQADNDDPVHGGWYIPGKYEFARIADNLTIINKALADAGLTLITENYWISHKSTGYKVYEKVGYVSGSDLSTVSYINCDPDGGGKNARLICAFYKGKEWTAGEVTGVTLDKTSAEMVVGEGTLTLTHTLSVYGGGEATNSNVTWTSSKESVATVSDGVVTAVGAGSATITVTTDDGGFEAICTVSVTDPNARNHVAVGDYVYNDGTWSFGTESPTSDKTVAGIVCYVGDELSNDTELMKVSNSYNVLVVGLGNYSGDIVYVGNLSNGGNDFWKGNSGSMIPTYNKISSSSDVSSSYFAYSLFYSFKFANTWAAVKSFLLSDYPQSNVYTGATWWYPASVTEYNAIVEMQKNENLTLEGYTKITSMMYSTLYLDSNSGYVYRYNPIEKTYDTKEGAYTNNGHTHRRVFATTLADHE